LKLLDNQTYLQHLETHEGHEQEKTRIIEEIHLNERFKYNKKGLTKYSLNEIKRLMKYLDPENRQKLADIIMADINLEENETKPFPHGLKIPLQRT